MTAKDYAGNWTNHELIVPRPWFLIHLFIYLFTDSLLFSFRNKSEKKTRSLWESGFVCRAGFTVIRQEMFHSVRVQNSKLDRWQDVMMMSWVRGYASIQVNDTTNGCGITGTRDLSVIRWMLYCCAIQEPITVLFFSIFFFIYFSQIFLPKFSLILFPSWSIGFCTIICFWATGAHKGQTNPALDPPISPRKKPIWFI